MRPFISFLLFLLTASAISAQDIPPDLLEKANAGDPSAQTKIGNIYLVGDADIVHTGSGFELDFTVAPDHKKAAEWFLRAANQGYAVAQTYLGLIYQYGGDGISQDYQKAIKWYLKAANQGDSVAQCSLGFMYRFGYGVPQDYKRAVEWYLRAANRGDSMAQYALLVMSDEGSVPQNYKKAVELLLKIFKPSYTDTNLNLVITHLKAELGKSLALGAALLPYQ
jgi:TPR repeat protein